MIDQAIVASLVMTFFNIGVIGGWQRLVHGLDTDAQKQAGYPRRHELIYGAYEVVIAALLLGSAHFTSGFAQALLVDIQLVVALNFTNALKTLPAVIPTVLLNFGLFAVLVGGADWQLGLAVVIYLCWLAVAQVYFSPFDDHMMIHVLATLVAGGGFWVLMQASWAILATMKAALLIGFVVATLGSFTYMLLLRRERLIDRANARAVRFDGLTDAYNWLSFRKALTHRFVQAEDLSLLALDIDHFKPVNQRFGRAVGDQVLIVFVDTLQATLETIAPQAMLARIGGEEFMVILPHTNAAQALAVARACQARIREVLIPLADSDAIAVTATIGVATRQEEDHHARELYHRAEANLLAAQAAGRDRIGTGTK
ncbi:GGDEF domain-containing protein [Lacticaseibacillus sp. N501-2]|uniref:GGDEF domain-containing protein n=1 Tax=Lacticaseibacillus salsurae TaxID=3367729 RepID=UPI0038B3D9F4